MNIRFSLDFIDDNSERISFHKIDEITVEEFHKYSSQSEIYKYLEFEPFKSFKETEDYLEKIDNRINSGLSDYRFLKFHTSDEIIGLMGFTSFNAYRKSIEFGYGISPKYQRRGLFKEASNFLINSLFKKNLIHRVYSITSIYNEGSIKGLHSLAFMKEGVLRDYYLKNNIYFDAVLYSKINN